MALSSDSGGTILQLLLDEQRASAAKLEKLASSILSKDDFNHYVTRADKRIDKVYDDLNIYAKLFQASDLLHVQQANEVKMMKDFQTNLSSVGKWFARVVFVAMLGVATSIFPTFIANLHKPSSVANAPVVIPSTTPIKMHITKGP